MSLFVRYVPIILGGGGGGGGSIIIGTLDSQTPSADGAVASGMTLYLQSASDTEPGLVNTTAQTFLGDKTVDGILLADNLSGTNTGDVTLGTANGLSLVGQALSLGLSSTSTTGALSDTDWNTFNNKQVAGNYITALTGDVSATGPGSVAATVNSVGGKTASEIAQSVDDTQAATSASTPDTIVKRDGSSNFAAGTITADLDRASGTLGVGANANVINIGNPGAVVNIQGTTIYEETTQLQVSDPLISINVGGGAGSGANSGIEIEENSVITGYAETSSDRNSWQLKAPNTTGIATITPGVSGITLDQSSHSPVTLAAVGSSPNANAASLSGQVLNLQPADGSNPGVITSGTQTIGGAKTFNGALVAGSTLNVTGTTTLATGLTGIAHLSSGVVSASAVLLGSEVSGTLPIANGGTGQTTKAPAFDALSPMTTAGDLIYGGASGTGTRLGIGSTNDVLTVVGGVPTWQAPSGSSFVEPTVQEFTSGGTYNAPTSPRSPLYIKVKIVGAGGGGAGSATQAAANGGSGGTGGNSTFGSNITAGGGSGSAWGTSVNGGAGGTPSITTSSTLKRVAAVPGGQGGPNVLILVASYAVGGDGGNSYFGCGASGGSSVNSGGVALANTGAGGGGAGSTQGMAASGAGGGAGAYIEAIITNVAALGPQTVTIGTGGIGGPAGTGGANGGAGGSGMCIVEEYYQ